MIPQWADVPFLVVVVAAAWLLLRTIRDHGPADPEPQP